MDHNKLFHVLVLGGSALTLGATGCSSATDPASPKTTDAAIDTGASSSETGADGVSTFDGSKDTKSAEADSTSSFDAPADGPVDPGSCDAVCKWDGGIPFCDGMCCIWGVAHPCCDPFMKKDAGK